MCRKILPIHRTFAEELAVFVGTQARSEDDLAPVYNAFRQAITVPVPLYFEDAASGIGQCAICGKLGALGRCAQCGLLFHIRCLVEGLRARPRFGKGALAPPPVGRERGLEPGVPCPLHERPSDEEARRHGFASAQEWYAKSAGGALIHPDCVEAAFQSLPLREENDLETAEGIAQDWRLIKGDYPSADCED